MKQEKITDFIYNFENVLRRDTFFTLRKIPQGILLLAWHQLQID